MYAKLTHQQAENERLRAWIDDLQSGMYVNCVYCGHRYGPGETTPVSMADSLKAHIEQCPKHPMSTLKAENERLKAELAIYKKARKVCSDCAGMTRLRDGLRKIVDADDNQSYMRKIARALLEDKPPW